MRVALIASFLANVVLTVASLALLPDRVAIHFGPRGLPDNWASKEANALLLLGLQVLLFGLMVLTPRLIFILPPRWVNLPNKDYWLQPENRSSTLALLSRHLWQFGTALLLFMFLAGLLAVLANVSDPVRLDLPLFLTALGGFLAYSVCWCVCLYRAFRLPASP